MSSLKMKRGGEIALPPKLQQRYGFRPDTPIRVIETRSGILLIPLTAAPMEAALRRELDEWQSLSRATWEMFPYNEARP